jgi:hypothetical protein
MGSGASTRLTCRYRRSLAVEDARVKIQTERLR